MNTCSSSQVCVAARQMCVRGVFVMQALQLGAEAALAQRDLALRQYWDAQVSSLLARPEVKDKVMALAREVRHGGNTVLHPSLCTMMPDCGMAFGG